MPIELALVLAQVAGIQNGLLMILGGGWVVRPPAAAAAGPAAIAFLIRVPRHEAGSGHELRLELLDSEDRVVVIEPPAGPGPMIFETDFDANGLDDPSLTTPLVVSLGINLQPFPLARRSEYRWRAYIDGETQESWTLPFRTTPPRPPRQSR
jgi:hypothetical protein